ncbi:hypothetical protein D9619_003783 [Psilocybe cf. subviscida]|uniref:Uncharacterized protein n=1 Tax=Psilocybe cf. subviscida TaxID=2480587 RepID=A0A8H5AWR1_9AGAR|nr:hypothetical protein D9619_003783 [Psilocybe cf. subviscida]
MSIPMSTATESASSSTTTLASSTSTMCDASDASLPPTSNNLNREERLRLLRSTRKLGALLGTTPMFIDTELSESDYIAPLASPRTKSRRREGRIFPGRAGSPTSSISSIEDYVIVPQGVQSSNYQNVFSPDDREATSSTSAAAAARRASVSDIARASNVSIGTTASRKRKARGPIPVALVFDMPRSGSASGVGAHSRSAVTSRFGTNGASVSKKATAGMKPSNRAQPQPSLFLRLRPAFNRTSNIKQASPVPANSPYINLPQPPTPPTPASQTRLPLSPSMATFANSNLSSASIASSHYSTTKGGYFDAGKSSQPYDELDYMDTTSEARRALTERDRRRKMAKLARTLGENVPPELVFRPPPRRSSAAYASASFGLQSYPKPPPPPPVVPGLPKLAVAEVPPPPTVSASVAPAPSTSSSRTSKKTRPRSLTLAPSSSTDTTRGTTSMDAPASPAMVQSGHRATKSLGRAKSVKPITTPASASVEHPFADATRSASRAGEAGFGRRKEREWSGEWNLKDMNDVAARLRGLKA